jgi:hypothetical protein
MFIKFTFKSNHLFIIFCLIRSLRKKRYTMNSRFLRHVGTRFSTRLKHEYTKPTLSRHFSTTSVFSIKQTSNAHDPMDASISGRNTRLNLDAKKFGMTRVPISEQKRKFNVTNDLNITQEEVLFSLNQLLYC